MPFAEFFASLGLIGAVQFITGWLMEGMDILKDSFGIAIRKKRRRAGCSFPIPLRKSRKAQKFLQ